MSLAVVDREPTKAFVFALVAIYAPLVL